MRLSLSLIVFCLAVAPISLAAPVIGFENGAVKITGGVRGGRMACTFIERAPLLMRSGSLVVADTDNDAEIRIPLPAALSDRAVWAAVDLETGEYTVATPKGVVGEIGFRGHSFKTNAGQLKRLQSDNFARLHLLVVRPREGAWDLRSVDGGTGDSDSREDQKLELDIESLQPLNGFGPPPKRFEKGDVIIILDPRTSEVFAATVGK